MLIGGIEVYDIRKTVDPTDALLDVLSDYLNKPDVRITTRYIVPRLFVNALIRSARR